MNADYGYSSRRCRWCGAGGSGWDCGGPNCVPNNMRDAIMRWKHDFGWRWKYRLQVAWKTGDYEGASKDDERLLEQAHEKFGVRCLGGPNNVPGR